MTHAAQEAHHARALLAAPDPSRQPPRFSMRNRYSIFVGLMKVLLPAMAAALILLVVAWPQLKMNDERFRLGVSRLSLEQADNLTMLNARFDGIDDKGQPYTITADTATQSPREADTVELELPEADITLTDGTWLALTARSGDYHRRSQRLELEGAVSLYHDKGFEMRTEAARIDLEAGTAEGAEPVAGQGTAGTIDSEGFRILDRGQRIIFTGKSRLVLNPKAQDSLR